MFNLLLMLAWMVTTVMSVNALDKSLRVYILDYEVKRPKILKTIAIGMIWLSITISILFAVFS